jgi:hypothetical protein
MLVNMGDLPQPEMDVLSETLTSRIRKTGSLPSTNSNNQENVSQSSQQISNEEKTSVSENNHLFSQMQSSTFSKLYFPTEFDKDIIKT